jgi:hypothetical protein
VLQGCAKKIQLQRLLSNLALQLGCARRPPNPEALSRQPQRLSTTGPERPVPLVQKITVNPEFSRQTRHIRRGFHPRQRSQLELS